MEVFFSSFHFFSNWTNKDKEEDDNFSFLCTSLLNWPSPQISEQGKENTGKQIFSLPSFNFSPTERIKKKRTGRW